MWTDESIFYHIYPLGFCGVPKLNDFSEKTYARIYKISEHITHLKKLGVNAVYIGPLFQSTAHGYDTVDYFNLDCRLGRNEDFAKVCRQLHANGIRIVLDGVFNHVGRDFWAFNEVREKKGHSEFTDWFFINWDSNNQYNDGFSYDCWEGHSNLVKLNLNSPAVKQHIFNAVMSWVNNFDIDGLRLDVAYCLDKTFLKELRIFCKALKPDFWLMGEVIHGDYNELMNEELLDSVTNYECYKGLYSSCNDKNMFEIAHSIKRQDSLYHGKCLYTFLDNHDVTRIASILKDKRDLKLLYTLLFAMPGIPSIYYGGEFGLEGNKEQGDITLRPSAEQREYTALTQHIKNLCHISKHPIFSIGTYKEIHLANTLYCFAREMDSDRMVCAVNIGDMEEHINCEGEIIQMPPKSAQIYLNGQCLSYETA